MKDGDVVIVSLPQQDGSIKPRPALCLRRVPTFQDLLVCGISSRPNWTRRPLRPIPITGTAGGLC